MPELKVAELEVLCFSINCPTCGRPRFIFDCSKGLLAEPPKVKQFDNGSPSLIGLRSPPFDQEEWLDGEIEIQAKCDQCETHFIIRRPQRWKGSATGIDVSNSPAPVTS